MATDAATRPTKPIIAFGTQSVSIWSFKVSHKVVPPYPPEPLLFMERKPEIMVANGDKLLKRALKVAEFRGRPVLDIGCGYGRMAYALAKHGFADTYIGVDILKRHIDWLTENFTAKLPNYNFAHLDIKNDRYNKNGVLGANDFSIPVSEAPDLIFLLSVFTHMYERELCIYLDRIAERMDTKSILYSTFFLSNPEMRRLESAGRSGYPMKHQLNDHCWYFNPEDPLHAIAYDETWLRAEMLKRDLYPIATFYGSIAGRPGAVSEQDTIFIGKL